MAHRVIRSRSLRPSRPIRTVCAWCATQNRPAAVLVDVPLDARGLSHGICPACRSSFRSNRVTFAVAQPAAVPHH